MDGRKYNSLETVAPGNFTPPQRQRLEAFTAAVGLLGNNTDHAVLLDVAQWIASGETLS